MRKLILSILALAFAVPAFAGGQIDVKPSQAVAISQATPGTTNGVVATGNAAAGATDSGKPVKAGGVYTTTSPTLTDGQRGNLQVDSRGNLKVAIFTPDGTLATSVGSGALADATSNTQGGNLGTRASPLVFNGTTWDRMRGDVNALSVSTAGLSSTYWYYSSGTSPILSNTTTAVTIKASCGASTRCFIDSCQIGSTALGAVVPLAIRDGAGGTVLFAVRGPTAGWLSPVSYHFEPPLRSTAATLLEIVTTTANTSGTYDVNCQGHSGT